MLVSAHLHGTIIHVCVEAHALVSAVKQQCIEKSGLDLIHLNINVDLAGLMPVGHQLTKWEGVRLAKVTGELLDDDQSIGSQLILRRRTTAISSICSFDSSLP